MISQIFKRLHEYLVSYKTNATSEFTSNAISIAEQQVKEGGFEAKLVRQAARKYVCHLLIRDTLRKSIVEMISVFLVLPILLFGILNNTIRKRKVSTAELLIVVSSKARLEVNPEIFAPPPQIAKTQHAYVSRGAISLDGTAIKITAIYLTVLLKNKVPYPIQASIKCMLELGKLSALLDDFQPKSVMVFNEYDVSQPLQHYLCKLRKVDFYNCMHGDKDLSPIDCFSSADKFFVWSSDYIEMFSFMKFEGDFYVVGFPAYFKISTKNEVHETLFDIVLFPPTRKVLRSEKEFLEYDRFLALLNSLEGLKLAISLHPRSRDEQIQHFKNYPCLTSCVSDISGEALVSKSRIVLGYTSTLLLKAALNNRRVWVPQCNLTEEISTYHPLHKFSDVHLMSYDAIINSAATVSEIKPDKIYV